MVQGLVKLGFMIFISGLLVSCNTVQSKPPPVVFKSAAHQPLAINARRLEIIDNWQMPIVGHYVGHQINPLPSNIVADWAAHVLRPAGGSGEVVFDIERVAVTLKDMPQKLDLKGLLSDQQSRNATAEIKAQIMWLQPVGGTQARVDLSASHSITIRESANPNEVREALHKALKGALLRLDSQARKELAKIEKIIIP
uniref:ABC-type transport auxiliary lipoprotein component domain-containing protein n=1 Tax=uncultured alpha proteobacterium EBAC2C11 TaxID=295349 RepID=Q5UF31_9PROT|nr:unknown [uncultured alpha proteobacterium EBAC2C11]